MKSSSTDHLSGNDADMVGGIEKEARTTNFPPMETPTSKQRRDKMTNKGQQDEEEERGKTKTSSVDLIYPTKANDRSVVFSNSYYR